MINLWLDDVRPAPEGWHHAKTAEEAMEVLLTGDVEEASLDHDLGACLECGNCMLLKPCERVKNGYQLVMWMAEHGHWPRIKPKVHSMNPDGARWMRSAIDRYFPR